ncbi:hypothetical protein C8Q77DRAFT_349486 [Trametes polyzona]|nr:hypothetical protein C8Q77DRAFT_349486 [Trametes polyzona]
MASVSTIFTTVLGVPFPVSTVTVGNGAVTPTPTLTSTDGTSATTSASEPASTTDPGTPTTTSSDISTTTSATTTTSDTTTTTNSATTSDTTSATTSDTTSSVASTSSTTTSSAATTSSSAATTSSNPATTSSIASTVFATTTDAGGNTVTRTSVVFTTPTGVDTPASSNRNTGSKSFFQNTGAVAGVFTVVGLAVVVIVVAIVTNAIRRRRAKKLDREIAEAAAEAAHAPAFTDDDFYPDDRLGGGKGGSPGAGGGGGDLRSLTTGYSDTTHGTYAQAPMSTAESYNMAELAPYDYGAGAATGGAAGIGAMGGLNRARSMGQNQTTPYNAFAGPPPNSMPNPYENPGYGQPYAPRGGNEMDLLDAAGLAGAGAVGYTAAQQPYQQNNNNLARNPSLGPSAATSPSEQSAYSSPYAGQGAYAPQQDYNPYGAPHAGGYNPYGAPQQQAYPPQPYTNAGPAPVPVPTPSPPRPTSVVDPYGGYVDEPAPAANPIAPAQKEVEPRVPSPGPGRLLSGNFASPPASSEGHELQEDNGRMSIQDDDDYGYEPGRRVLKVANE